jgi:hypothetical protein
MKRTIVLAAVLGLLVMIGPASAVVIIDFTTGSGGNGGTITVNGSNASGSNIPVGNITVTGSVAGDGTYDTTGSSNGVFNGSASLSFDTSAGNNFIKIVGGVCSAPGPTNTTGLCPGASGLFGTQMVPNGTTLLTGTFSSKNVAVNSTGTGGFLVDVTGTGPDSKGAALLEALGVPLDTQWVFFALNIAGPSVGASQINFTSNSSDIENTQVPEPASILLLGTILVGVTQLLRRMSSKPSV